MSYYRNVEFWLPFNYIRFTFSLLFDILPNPLPQPPLIPLKI